MKYMLRALFVVLLGFSNLAFARLDGVAVVDLRAALLQSDAAKAYSEEMKKDFTDEERRLRAVGEEARTLQERLKKDGPIMSETERNTLATELDEKAQEFNFLKNKYQAAIAKREELFLQNSKPKVDAALKEIAQKNQLKLILPGKLAVFSDPALDITPQLIEALNK